MTVNEGVPTGHDLEHLISFTDMILVTGSAGFIGSRVVEQLLQLGFRRIRCFVRPSSNRQKLAALAERFAGRAELEILEGNLISKEDCARAAKGVALVYHLAAESGKSFASSIMNCAVTTRNLLEALRNESGIKRFVNVSSFTVYTNSGKPREPLFDESCPIENDPVARGDAYCYAKLKQDELVRQYGERYKLPYVIVRPGVVYGPGKERIHGRVGLDTFGIFLHLGGSNSIPLTHVDNCADAIVLAGLKQGVDGEVFNVVDDDLPSSGDFLRMYKEQVRRFPSIYVPHAVSFALCFLWEKYSAWSEGQLPPIHNRRSWTASWKSAIYSNDKIKQRLGWRPRVRTRDGVAQFLAACRNKIASA